MHGARQLDLTSLWMALDDRWPALTFREFVYAAALAHEMRIGGRA
jgi:hypothetical protein